MAISSKIPFTRQKYQEMQQQVDVLRTELIAVKIRLKDAREMGDLSENGAYKYAKFEISRIYRELRTLVDLLERGEVVTPVSGSSSGFGSYVTLKTAQGKMTRYQLVSQYESDPAHLKLSLESPIAKAIAGKAAGSIVELETPRGKVVYTVVAWE